MYLVCIYVSQGKVAVCQGVKMLSPSIFGMTVTDAMDAYLTGGVDRPAASGTRITAAATTSTIPIYPYLRNHQ